MSVRRRFLVPLVIVGAVALSGCTASVERTVSADTVAEAAEDALESQVGQRPEIDCGEDAVAYSAGTDVECLLTDPTTGSEFDTTVTLEALEDEDDLAVSVVVADAPRG